MSTKVKTIWQTMKLGDIIKLEYGKPLPDSKRNPSGAYPVYGANGEKNRTDEYYYDQKSIIVGRKGSAGEINFTEKKFWPLDVTYFVTFDDKKYDLNFIYYLLSNLNLPKLAKGIKPGINRNEVYSINVKIPSLHEQQRIVAILDEAFSAITAAKENTEKNIKNSRRIFHSYLQNIFDNPEKEWIKKKLEDICNIKHGYAFKSKDFQTDFSGNNPIVLTPGNFSENGKLFFNEKNTKRCIGKHSDEFKFNIDDLVVVMTDLSSKMKILGKPAFIKDKNILHNQRIGRFIFNDNSLNKFYLFYYLKTNSYLKNIKETATGTIVRHTAPKRILDNIISYPPLHEQQRIVDKLDMLFDKAKTLESIYQKKLVYLEELKKSILQKAFSGELTQQDANIPL